MSRVRALGRPQRGQAMIETAVVLIVFLTIVFGLFDLGRLVFLQSQLENGVREGARLGKVTQPYSATQVQAIVTSQAGLATATVVPTCGGGCAYGSTLTVTATLPVDIIASGLLPGLGSPTLSASASVRIE